MARDSDQLVCGLHAVLALLERAPDQILELWIMRGDKANARLAQARKLASAAHIHVHDCDRTTLDALVEQGVQHQGIVARRSPAPNWDEGALPDLIANASKPPLLLILDGVQDPHNLGACLRSADAAGVLAVIAPRDRAVGLTPTARKVASGAAEMVPFIQVTNLARTLRDLKEAGVWLVGADGDAEMSLYQCDLRGPIAIIMGAEDEGMRRLTREHCDFLVHIPMAGSVSSLNVSVATGVCLFEAVRQRKL